MRRTRELISSLVCTVILGGTVGETYAAPVRPFGIEHVREFSLRGDGKYDVICIDGEAEVRSPKDLKDGIVCTHIKLLNGPWALFSGGTEEGMRICDLKIAHLTGKNRILSIEAGYAAPCGGPLEKSEDCNGFLCSLRLGETFYSLEFSVKDRVTLTRLNDGFTAVFSGKNAGATSSEE